jgi:fructose-bisphosphate aldolase, class II
MSIVNLKEVLIAADKGKYGVGAFNTINLEMSKAIILAADEEKSPVIIQIAELLFSFMPDWEALTVATMKLAKEAKVPVVIHLDHGMTYKNIVRAMSMGFSGVMIDGSHLGFDENVHETKEVVKVAQQLNIPVEAELGTVPGEEGVYSSQETVLTDAGLVEKYLDLTEVDALAICIGNAHGNHIKVPCLDLKRLQEIRKVSTVPLVLHGGSGLTDDDFRNCIKFGISKINIFTDLCVAAKNKLNTSFHEVVSKDNKVKEMSYPRVITETIEAVKQETIKKMRLFGSSNKA